MAKVKFAGSWSGVLEVELEEWTVIMLRKEVSLKSGLEVESIKLIFSGKVLLDGDEKLSQIGIKNNSKILTSRICAEEGRSLGKELLAEEERDDRLSRIKAAAVSLSTRHAEGTLPIEEFNLELEDQSGQKVNLGSETDQQAVMMGLMLHAKGKRLLKTDQYKDALEVLTMGEEAFSLCNPKVLEMVDNVPILQIDMVWCYFMLRDISLLSEAGKRLAIAREGLERAYGKDASRVRILQQGRYPELALHLRLELLEAVVAYHSGGVVKSKKLLISAQAKYSQLQVPDEALSLLMSMGYKERESKRALRMSNQKVDMAVDFLVEERAKRQKKREENLLRQKEIMEQKQYGVTPLRKAVDLKMLKQLVAIGFEKELAAEALRRNENDEQKALDDLTNSETSSGIQLQVVSRKLRKQRRDADAVIEELVAMGFDRSLVVAAVRAFGTRDGALNQLLQQGGENALPAVLPNAIPAANNISNPAAPATATNTSEPVTESNNQNDEGSLQGVGTEEERDEEMEGMLAQELQQNDAYSDYDIEVTKEGEAINEYLALIATSENNDKGSSSH